MPSDVTNQQQLYSFVSRTHSFESRTHDFKSDIKLDIGTYNSIACAVMRHIYKQGHRKVSIPSQNKIL